MKRNFLVKILGGMVLVVGIIDAALQPVQAVTFNPPPDNSAPLGGSGGASRNGFIPPPDNAAPSGGSGGASRNGFIPPPDNAAPSGGSGGASRNGFIPPPDNAAPSGGSGGASRNGFVPPPDNAAPSGGSGGASRNGFVPPPDNAAPSGGSGGASRNGFTPPPDNATPAYGGGGASRTNLYGSIGASTDQLFSMMALTPQSFYGTTLSERPTILVYLPASNAREAVFSLKDEDRNLVYRMNIPISGESGIMMVQIPEDAPSLEVGKNYQWFLTLKLDGTLTPASPFVDGWIKRIEPDSALAQTLAQNNPVEVSTELAENGVWYDTAAMWATLRREQPANEAITQEWEELLISVGLDEVVAESITVALPN